MKGLLCLQQKLPDQHNSRSSSHVPQAERAKGHMLGFLSHLLPPHRGDMNEH